MKSTIHALLLLLFLAPFYLGAQESTAKWIYYPGDFEIYIQNKLNMERSERNQPYPPFWRTDMPYCILDFSKQVTLKQPEKASIYVDGQYYISINDKILYDFDPQEFEIPAGTNNIRIHVANFQTVPSMLFQSKSIPSDDTWDVVYNGNAIHASVYNSSNPSTPPSSFRLQTKPMKAQSVVKEANYTLYDFGKNTFGFPILEGLKGNGKVYLYYGESKEEAMADKTAETWDVIHVNGDNPQNDTLATKAFRFIKVVGDPATSFKDLSMLYEYLPVTYRGKFSCSDELLNRIYSTALYTFHLTTRECHLDGIKRDRWSWSGDALQSYWMNFYSFFDEDVNKRTLWGLRGHSPINCHINTILDYTYYWMIGIESQYLYTGDTTFIKQIYPRMKETMQFATSRLNNEGLAAGMPGDWVFVDWAPMSKDGVLSFEQLLYIKSLKAIATCAEVANDKETATKASQQYDHLLKQFNDLFWSDQKKAYIHNLINNKRTEEVTRYANMFSILFDMTDASKKEEIKESVLMNPNILQITTPYMKFYELASLCEIGEYKKVLDYVRSYWGGMLSLGATTFWEAYDPKAAANEHYQMYGRPFGKSLCHAWGANPIYLFGRYYLGVVPTKPGYKEYNIQPELGGLQWINGAVPTPNGDIQIKMDTKKIEVTSPKEGIGTLIIKSGKKPVCKGVTVNPKGDKTYHITLDKPNYHYVITYKAL